MKRLLFCVLILNLIISSSLMGQEDVQVSPDNNGILEYIAPETEERLQLFSEYTDFIEARCFRISDTVFVVEVLYKKQSEIKRSKIYYTLEEFTAFRNNVTNRLKAENPETILNQTGRTRLLSVSTITGLAYYGWAVPSVFEVDDGKAVIGMYMLTAGASFYLPYAMTRNNKVSESQADLFMYGQTRGAAHGYILNTALFKNPEFNVGSILGISLSIGEGIIGYRWAKKEKMTRGQALTIGLGADFGAGIFAGASHAFGLLDSDVERRLSATVLFGTSAGIFVGNWFRKTFNYSTGDVYMMRSLGFLGAYVPAALVAIAETDEPKFATGTAALGALGGLSLGHYIAQQNSYTAGQGRLIALGQTAGGLVGLGTGYLISSDNDNAYKVWLTGSILGSVGGFALMNHLFSNRNVREKSKKQAFHFGLNPQGFVGLAQRNKTRDPRYDAPMVYANLRF